METLIHIAPSSPEMFMRLSLRNALLVIVASLPLFAQAATKAEDSAVVTHYADMAAAIFGDAHQQALKLQANINAFLAAPSKETLQQAKTAWIAARVPYMQSEVFRFGNPVVDDWEGQVNSWPLDEGLIDYVAEDYVSALGNIGATLNIIANPSIDLGGTVLDTTTLSPEVLADLNELGGSEANVATGYHAIEFLLWGQDLHGNALGAGERPYTDYVNGDDCSHGHCERRREYLSAVTQLLINDLAEMKAQWTAGNKGNYRETLLELDPKHAIARMFYGMGSLSLGELGGERIKVALEANSSEDEHDCFSDNTHWAHYYDGLGIQNVFLGRYKTTDGKEITGPSVRDYVAAQNPEAATATEQALSQSMAALSTLVKTAEAEDTPQKFDMLIAEGNTQGQEILADILNALVQQTRALEKAAAAVNIDPNQLGY
jgi:putative iron-regulated protein